MNMHKTSDIRYIGVNYHEIDLFEGQYAVPNGMAYNSYAIVDEKIAVMDSVDRHFAGEWLGHIAQALGGRTPDYLIVQHMEPDHSANIAEFMKVYAEATIVSSAKAFASASELLPARRLALRMRMFLAISVFSFSKRLDAAAVI